MRKEVLQELQNFLETNFQDFHIGRGYRNPAQVLSAKERSKAISIVPASDTQKRLNTKKQITWKILLIVSLRAGTPQEGIDALVETLEAIEKAVEKTTLNGLVLDVNVVGSIFNPEVAHPFYEAALQLEVLYRR
ncbi:hypothetical protein [Desulfurobacterium thermolithotrophum]|uniref:hypothetical protein n=1 Tax=Desulfurobacterium thermolithotrophum TaxID=64160 RepID=UPI0013CF4774|nr:hypothetical protein [Desulfurobacterium thermolithotrophum]